MRYLAIISLSVLATTALLASSRADSLSPYFKGAGWNVVLITGQHAKTCIIQSSDEQVGYNVWGQPARLEISFVLRHEPASKAGNLEFRVPGLAAATSIPYLITPQRVVIAYASPANFRYLGRASELELKFDQKTYHLNAMVPRDVLTAYQRCIEDRK